MEVPVEVGLYTLVGFVVLDIAVGKYLSHRKHKQLKRMFNTDHEGTQKYLDKRVGSLEEKFYESVGREPIRPVIKNLVDCSRYETALRQNIEQAMIPKI